MRVGLAGADMGAAWLLPQIVGLSRATELLMLGDPVEAPAALAMGLAHRVVPVERVARRGRRRSRCGSARGPLVRARHDQGDALRASRAWRLEEALEAEAQAQQICMETRDFREAYEAFVEKREPRFEGR